VVWLTGRNLAYKSLCYLSLAVLFLNKWRKTERESVSTDYKETAVRTEEALMFLSFM